MQWRDPLARLQSAGPASAFETGARIMGNAAIFLRLPRRRERC
jgi:hypothetical protein